jgi:hypothetical protein
MTESFPFPGTGTLPKFPYRDGDYYVGKAVWFISGPVSYYPDGRRKGKDRPTLTRYSGKITKQIGEYLVCVVTDDDCVPRWLNLLNSYEGRRIQLML